MHVIALLALIAAVLSGLGASFLTTFAVLAWTLIAIAALVWAWSIRAWFRARAARAAAPTIAAPPAAPSPPRPASDPADDVLNDLLHKR